MVAKFLTDEEVEQRIREFLQKHDYQFIEKFLVQKRLKPVDFAIEKKNARIAIMLFLWRRSLPYDKIYYLEEYLQKYGFSKIILVTRQISPRAKEIIRKENLAIELVFESDFRMMKESPLLGKL
ncbi:MAG: hypothetical protein GF308_17430 [Candidatus Heimdallarchaeota archaeon]|nr:hypothetical protein [Candidatus Heimdallarchaeota archaeon]